MRVDLFACWYLLSHARSDNSVEQLSSSSTNSKVIEEFGFRETFNGVGIFVYKDGQEYKIVAVEN